MVAFFSRVVHRTQICRMALDTETMEGQPDRDTFLGVFYEHYVHWLVEPFWLGDLSNDGKSETLRLDKRLLKICFFRVLPDEGRCVRVYVCTICAAVCVYGIHVCMDFHVCVYGFMYRCMYALCMCVLRMCSGVCMRVCAYKSCLSFQA